ncbi:reverse transcriptase domain-containing protein [Tanacetum coccineum]
MKPKTIAQARRNMIKYLKNQGNYKITDFKGMSYNDIRPIFEKVWDFNQNIVPMDAEHGSEKQESPAKEKSSEKVVEEEIGTQEELKQDVKEPAAKRKKSIPRKTTRKRQKLEEDAEKDELKGFLDIVPREEAPIEVESISTKFPIVDWKTCVLTETFMYYQVFRGDGSSKNYKVLSEMLEDFDRLDVEELFRLVKERYSTSRPEGFDLMLWGDLHTLFEPDEDDEIWRDQHEYNLLSWRLCDFCGIHILLMDNGLAIHMLTEKKYPLSQEMLTKMLSRKLEVDHESSQAFELLRKGKTEETSKITIYERCFVVLLNKIPFKEKDPRSFTIPCVIGKMGIDKALADLGQALAYCQYFYVCLRLDLGELKPTRMCIELANNTTQYPRGIAENVIVKIDKFIFPVDFVVLDMKDHKIPIILRRPFLATTHAMIDVFNKKISFEVLTQHKAALAWKVVDIKGISPSFCTHKILMEDNFKPVVQPLRRLNPKVQDVVKAEIVKLLDSGLIYAISDSPWVSPIHVVPKKGEGITVNNLSTITSSSQPEQSPDGGFSGYFQIPLAPEDQEKNTFTCPYRTFAYRRMPFGLCNASATFQKCITTIFHDMCKDFMDVFMDDFSIFRNPFDSCLTNLSKMLARCEETNLVLNWEKCHFMVKEGIVLGHKISKSSIEVDRAKIDVIAKLPYPTNVKGVRSFLGHAG